MKYLIPAFAFLFLASFSSHGQEVIIDTTFAKDKPGAAPAVDPGAPCPLEHPSSIGLSEGSSVSVLAQPDGNIKPPALLLTSPEGAFSSYTHIITWGGFQTALDSGKYELTFTVESFDSSLGVAMIRVDLDSDGWIKTNPDQPVSGTAPFAIFARDSGLSEVKMAIDLDKRLWSVWINGEERTLDRPMPASDPASPVSISKVMFMTSGARKGIDEPPVFESGGRYILGPVKLVKVSN
jgi:hypothetical protein